jgi:Resolvase, N terminal domain
MNTIISIGTSAKITREHLQRLAVVYVRQSTLAQVRDHGESTARQYALSDDAQRLGWPVDQVVVIDADLGVSGRGGSARTGFKDLVGRVCVGEVGAVFGLEVSRLARSTADLQRLLELCSLTDTLIIDGDGIYDLGLFNDRMLLGLSVPDSCPSSTSSTWARGPLFPRCRLVIWSCPTTSLTSPRSSPSGERLGGGTGSGGGRAGRGERAL